MFPHNHPCFLWQFTKASTDSAGAGAASPPVTSPTQTSNPVLAEKKDYTETRIQVGTHMFQCVGKSIFGFKHIQHLCCSVFPRRAKGHGALHSKRAFYHAI
ncbi:hypothetical protein DPMN_128823 [Dreissena polymorpha]|uniref:Uncharacterized protein n=1 Tax=Dreissena polymorpha TaxID=45954 RepID=A0A9D4JWT2_DREPO|nr:hypothetical protein DPMN_128823 [Dreissena polymorpha]